MNPNQANSKLLMLAQVFKEFSSKAEGKTPEETEKSLRHMAIECAGEFYDAIVHVLVHPTAEDIAFLTTEAKVCFAIGGMYLADTDGPEALTKKLLEIEVSIQNYLSYKASTLAGGKTANRDLLNLIELNMPAEAKVAFKPNPIASEEAAPAQKVTRKYVKKAAAAPAKKAAKKAPKKAGKKKAAKKSVKSK